MKSFLINTKWLEKEKKLQNSMNTISNKYYDLFMNAY